MSYQTTNPEGAKTMLEGDDSVAFVDVRTVREHQEGHVQGAYNVPAFVRDSIGRMSPNQDFVATMERNFDKSKTLVLGCEIGRRSGMACQMLAAAGFTSLVNMHGGYRGFPEPDGSISEPGWQALGYPTAVETLERRSYEELRGE